MPFDPSDLASLLGTMFVGASALLFVAAIGWRIAVRPTMRALLSTAPHAPRTIRSCSAVCPSSRTRSGG